jgi:hypothetical protein
MQSHYFTVFYRNQQLAKAKTKSQSGVTCLLFVEHMPVTHFTIDADRSETAGMAFFVLFVDV